MKQVKIFFLAFLAFLYLPLSGFCAEKLLMLPLQTDSTISTADAKIIEDKVKSTLSKSYDLLSVEGLENHSILKENLYNNKVFADFAKKYNVNKVVNGSLSKKNGTYLIELRLISVKSKNLLVASFRESKSFDNLNFNAEAAALPLLNYTEKEWVDSFNGHSTSIFMGSGRIVSLAYSFSIYNFSFSPSIGLNLYEIDNSYFYGLATGFKISYSLQKVNTFLRPYVFSEYSHHFSIKNYTKRDSMNFGIGFFVFDRFFFESSFMYLFKQIENLQGEATKNSFVIGFGYRLSF